MSKRQMVAGVMSASLLVAALPGLAFAQDAEPYAAEQVEWLLQSWSDGEAMMDIPEGVETTLFLSGGDVNGSAGCNSYFGSYDIDESSLSFGPMGVTAMICGEPAQSVEDAYLPLLETTAGWSVDDEGMLSLTDAAGTVVLVYGEPPVDITGTEVDALVAELENLQAQIDEASAEVAALAEDAASVNVKKITNRISANESDIAALQETTKGLNVANLKKRISANESDIAALQESDKKQDERITALEEAALEAVPLPE